MYTKYIIIHKNLLCVNLISRIYILTKKKLFTVSKKFTTYGIIGYNHESALLMTY